MVYPITTLPLPALVGLDAAVQALLLLAVEPRLGGVVFAAPAGTGKSSLARGFAMLGVRGQGSGVKEFELAPDPRSLTPFIELPASADEEALLGGLDMEATLRTGRRVARQGLLARAHGGAIYADQINLLSDAAANALLGSLDAGEVRLEREGLSTRAPARFTLLASYDPSEGQPRRHLLDRIGLWVALPAHTEAGIRAEVVRRNLLATENTEILKRRKEGGKQKPASTISVSPVSSLDEEAVLLRELVAAARKGLAEVHIGDDQIGQLAAAALAFGVEGHRADGFAVYAACASAALGLREEVEQADLELAVRLVIMPRATRTPEVEDQPQQQEPRPENREPQPPEPSQEDVEQSTADNGQIPEEQVFAALTTELPAELEQLPFKALRRGKTGSRGSTSGTRGRHIRSTLGDVRRKRIDIPATLRAAAPWQELRGQGSGVRVQKQNTRPLTPDPRPLALQAEDLRVKQFKSKAGALFLFAVDASGSMALHRMRQAKGAVHALLQRAYVHRDRVALLAFRGEKAELLLPPSQSVELARRALDTLPTGGGTPLAAALLAAVEVAKQARGRGIMQTVLVLLTDGRANVALQSGREGVAEELQTLGRSVAAAGIHALVVDTQRSYLSRGEAHKLAGWLGGQYIYLPNAQGSDIAEMAGEAVER